MLFALLLSSARADDAIASPGDAVVMTVDAEGAQIYECKSDAQASSSGSSANRSQRY
jgi:hypothetical protein